MALSPSNYLQITCSNIAYVYMLKHACNTAIVLCKYIYTSAILCNHKICFVLKTYFVDSHQRCNENDVTYSNLIPPL